MERNRRVVTRREDEQRAVKPKAVKPVEPLSPEERRARFKQRLGDVTRARWADPVKRAALLESMRTAWAR
jgi:hypothetical protein